MQGNLLLESITKTFAGRGNEGEVVAVDNVTLSIDESEFITLLGPSGCGKTTTLRLIAGFEVPTQGKIILDGENITNRAPNKRDMAMVFQSYALFPHMSVFDNIAYGLKIRGLPRATIKEKVKDILLQVGLPDHGGRRPNELSGGQQQRIALARSLVMEPRVLLFDEPLSNLDAKLRVQMRTEIRALQRRLNTTSVYVTHDQEEAMALSDRIVVMNKGQIEQMGSPDEIYRHPTTRFVADFIGRANFFETKIDSMEGKRATVHLLGQSVSVPMTQSGFATNQTVLAMLRPESLTLQPDASLKQVTIQHAMYLGSQVEYIVDIDGKTYTVVDSDPRNQTIYEPGQTIGIDFVSETVHLLPLA